MTIKQFINAGALAAITLSAVQVRGGEFGSNDDFGGFFEQPASGQPAPEAAPEADPTTPEPVAPAQPSEPVDLTPAELAQAGTPPGPDASEADELEYRYTLERLADEHRGKLKVKEGVELAAQGNYEQALEAFAVAEDLLGDRPAVQAWRDSLAANKAKVLVRKADQAWKDRKYNDAQELARQALNVDPGNTNAKKIIASSPPPEPPIYKSDRIIERNLSSAEYLQRGKEAYLARDYGMAEEMFENVLYEDPWNRDAIRFLRKVASKKLAHEELEQEATAVHRMYELKKRWNRPLGERLERPEEMISVNPTIEDEACERIESQLKSIIIQELEFKGAEIQAVVEFLVQYARSQGQEINIVDQIRQASSSSSAAAPTAPTPDAGFGGGGADDFGGGFGDFGLPEAGGGDTGFPGASPTTAPSGNSGPNKVSLSLRRINMHKALDIITDSAGVRWRCEDGIIFIRSTNDASSFDTRFYRVDPNLFTDRVAGGASAGGNFGGGGGGGGFDDFGGGGGFDDFGGGGGAPSGGGATSGAMDVKSTFVSMGVQFPPGASITYNSLIGQLTVVNTAENFEMFEKVLQAIQVVPQQIEIEARFVEVQQEDIEELGFQWKFLDDVELAVKNGPGPVGSRERVVLNGSNSGITSGLRFFNFSGGTGVLEPKSVPLVTQGDVNAAIPSTFLGNILSVTGILTNPELQMVLHALDQSGRTDLLSAPRVTTLNNVNAQIEVVREIIYPTEFEFQEQNNSTTLNLDGGQQAFIPPAVRPESFETRETGVILNVTPSVSTDNYTINLTLVPEIAELVDWIQYGAVYPRPDGGEFVLNIPQPVFDSRNVTTTMIVWDGHTVVMGGLIREDLVTVDDKIPLLGDIPLLGRLFRNEGQRSQKRNLLIFVTARLVNPAGEPIHNQSASSGGLPSVNNSPASD